MLNDFEIKNGQLIYRNTGARIPLNNHFVKELAATALFTLEISAISAARAARARIFVDQRQAVLKIGFSPEIPQVWYAIWPVCQLAGIDIVRDPAQADVLFYFDDREVAERLPENLPGTYVINRQCLDIRKSRVAEVFAETFGYDLAIDPMTHSGLAVMKSERNGVHDGQIIPCPYMTPRPGSVYQRLVENTRDGRIYTDIRTPVVGGMLPVVYLKQRTSATRFSNDNVSVELTTAAEQFSGEEQDRIIAFANRIGLEFGGLDILRDRKDGRIYIVDVNKTDMGPPTALPRPEKHIAIQKIADAFRSYVLLQVDQPHAA